MDKGTMEKIKTNVDSGLDSALQQLYTAAPQAEEALTSLSAQVGLQQKYLLGIGLIIAGLLVMAVLVALNLHTFLISVGLWLSLTYRSFNAIDGASVATPSDEALMELKHLLAYSVVASGFLVLEPVLVIVPFYFYIKYVALFAAYYADAFDNALVGLIKTRVIPLLKSSEDKKER